MKSMKQFTKAITIFAAMLVLVAIGTLSGRMMFNRSPKEDANMRNLMEEPSMPNTIPVLAEGSSDEYVTISDADVSGSGFSVPVKREAIPLGNGQTDIAALAKRLFIEAEAFISIKENANAIAAILESAQTDTYNLIADEAKISKQFFSDFLGSKAYKSEYAGATLTFFIEDERLEVEEASVIDGDILAAYSSFGETTNGESEVLETTEIIIKAQERSTHITITARHTSEGTQVSTSVNTY